MNSRKKAVFVSTAAALVMIALVLMPIWLNSASAYCGISRAAAQDGPCQEQQATIGFQGTQIAALVAANTGLQTAAAAQGANGYVPFVVTVQVPVTITPVPVQIVILRVGHPGDLNGEAVVIQNQGRTVVRLVGWRLRTPSGEELALRDARLQPEATLRIFTEAGNDTDTDMYLDLRHARWAIGDEVSLIDASGNVQATFAIE